MGLWRFEQSLDTLNRWNSFKELNERSQIKPNNFTPTAGNFLPMRPASVRKFLATHTNPMLLGNDGRDSIVLLLGPAAAASLPEFKNGDLAKLGADMNAVAAGIGVGTTIAVSAGTLGLVTTAALGGVVSTAVGSAAITKSMVPLASIVLKAGTLKLGSAATTLSAAGGIGAAIAIALAVVIGIAIARQAISDQMDRRLKWEFERGFDPIDVYSLVNDRDVSKRGFNRSAVFGYLLKMLIADPAERGLLTLKRPDPRTLGPGLPGVVTVRHQGAYVSDVTLSYLDANRRPVRIVRKARPIAQVDQFDIPGGARQVRLSIVMYTGLAGSQSKVTLINRLLRTDELSNKCFTTVGTTIVGRGLTQSACK
jgi:hypothetical protein